jgi:hypothetical protein
MPVLNRSLKKIKISNESAIPVKKEIWTRPKPSIDPENIIYRIKKKETQSLLDEDNQTSNSQSKKRKDDGLKNKEKEEKKNTLENLKNEINNHVDEMKNEKTEQKYDILGMPIFGNFSSLRSLISTTEIEKKVIPKNNFLYDIS